MTICVCPKCDGGIVINDDVMNCPLCGAYLGVSDGKNVGIVSQVPVVAGMVGSVSLLQPEVQSEAPGVAGGGSVKAPR